MNAAKRVLRYTIGTSDFRLKHIKGEIPELIRFNDRDLASDCEDGNSTAGSVFFLTRNVITWLSQKRYHRVRLSTLLSVVCRVKEFG